MSRVPLDALPKRWQSIARQNHRVLSNAESAYRAELAVAATRAMEEALLVATIGSDVAQRRRIVLTGLRGIAERLRGSVATATVSGRAAARRAARERLARELREVVRELQLQSPMTTPSADAAQDHAIADAAGAAFAAAWAAGLTAAVLRWARDPARDLARDLKAAAAAQQHRLDRLAATEVPRAYSEEHSEGAGWLAERHGESTWLPLVARRWDATNDRKICAFCASMDGALAPLGGSFRGDVLPGGAHPHCRCQEALIVLPIRLRERMPGRQVDDERPREAA